MNILSLLMGYDGTGPIGDIPSWLMGKNLAGVEWRTIENVSVANFVAKAKPLRDLIISIDPVQSGTGDPSPMNIRPITGWTGCNVVVSSTQDVQEGTIYSISWETEAGTVYGGTLDVTTGLLTVTYKCITYDGTETWIYRDSDGRLQKTLPTSQLAAPGTGPECLCSHYRYASGVSYPFFSISETGGSLFIYNSGFSSRDAFKSYLSDQYDAGTPLQFCYPLAVPSTVNLTSTEVVALFGQNYVWADTGNIIKLTYFG